MQGSLESVLIFGDALHVDKLACLQQRLQNRQDKCFCTVKVLPVMQKGVGGWPHSKHVACKAVRIVGLISGFTVPARQEGFGGFDLGKAMGILCTRRGLCLGVLIWGSTMGVMHKAGGYGGM